MSEVKWIKIVTNIFDNKKIRIIEKMPDGDSLIVVWLKLLILAGNVNDGGYVYFTEDIPYTDQMLATLFNRPMATIQLALKTFEEFGMIEVVDDIIHVSNWERYQNVEGMERIREQTRVRVARYRENKRIQCNVTCNATVTDGNATDIDKDLDKEKEIYIEKASSKKHKYGEFSHVLLTDEQYRKLVEDYGEKAVLEGIRNVDEYCEEKGKTYKNYNLTLRKWGIKANPLPKQKQKVVIDPEEEARQRAWEEGFHDA
jgi:predicted phage replisome organizer